MDTLRKAAISSSALGMVEQNKKKGSILLTENKLKERAQEKYRRNKETFLVISTPNTYSSK